MGLRDVQREAVRRGVFAEEHMHMRAFIIKMSAEGRKADLPDTVVLREKKPIGARGYGQDPPVLYTLHAHPFLGEGGRERGWKGQLDPRHRVKAWMRHDVIERGAVEHVRRRGRLEAAGRDEVRGPLSVVPFQR